MSFDVIVIGGGVVGAAAALALARSQLQVALVERRRAPAFLAAVDAFDNRVYSLTPSVCDWLRALEVWPQLPRERIARINAMRVYGDAGGHIEFDAIESGAAALAYVVEQAPLLDALWRALETCANVTLIAPAQGAALAWSEREVALQLASGEQLAARLIVAADGADSWARDNAGVEVHERAYAQRAVVANFAVEHAHQDTALQWFRSDGVLAWLPLPGKQISIVWSASEGIAAELMALDELAFTQRVAQAGGAPLGAMHLTAPRASFALRLLRAQEMVRPRLALAGDAAHCLHPLAGQGVNLGLEDAACLAQVLAERGMQRDCGDYHLLRRYERARKEDIVLMQSATDGLQRLFARDHAWLKYARNAGLTAVGRSGWLKRRLAGHAMS